MHDISKKAYYLWAVAIAAIVFYLYYDFSILWPENINWLLSARHDWGQHYLGWAFYRDEPWYFPIGTIKDYIYPVSTNIGFTDSIPLLAIPLKLLSPLLPEDFQYIGIWLFLCYVMTAFYSLKIFRLYNIRLILAIFATLLITGNPVLWFRGMHPALCAHGFIIASIYFYLCPVTKENASIINRNQVILTCITSLVHPYLFAMIVGFNFILPLRHYYYEKVLSFKKALSYPVFCCVISLSVWVIVGLIKIGPSESLAAGNSYGLYVFNLNSLYNSSTFSSLFPAFATDGSPFSYESFMYLGLGMGMLITGLLLYGSFSGQLLSIFKKNKFLYPLFALAGCMVLFAITNRVTFNDSVLFEIPLPQALLKIGSIFRASSRFFWVVYYLILFFFLLLFMKQRMAPAATIMLLLTITGLQAYDLRPLIHGRSLPTGTYNSPLNEEKWQSIIKDYDRIITYPPFQNHLLNNMDYQDLSFIALKNKAGISIGYTARDNIGANKQYTDSLTRILESGTMITNELYVTTPQYLEIFRALLHNKTAAIESLDGYYVIYAKANRHSPYFKQSINEQNKLDSIQGLYSQSGVVKELNNIVYSDKIMLNAEKITYTGNTLRVSGWAFHKEWNRTNKDSVFITLSEGERHFLVRASAIKRPDVATYYKHHQDNSGFAATAFTERLKLNNFTVGVAIKNRNGEWEYAAIGNIRDLINQAPQKIRILPPTLTQTGNIDNVYEEGEDIFINGWSAFIDRDARGTTARLVLLNEKDIYSVKVRNVLRTDVSAALKSKYDLDDSGFEVKLTKRDLPKGTYRLGILLTNGKEQSYLQTDKTLEIN